MNEIDRVRRVLAAGRRIADPADPLGREARARLPATSGLSAEGVELALTEHLETDDTDLPKLVARAGRAPQCHVVLAANVCTAPLRAIACAVATAPLVALRPSRRDPVVAELLARALDGMVTICDEVTPSEGDELHVYGSDATIAAIARGVPAGVVVRGHGSGLGIAVVEHADDEAARAVAADLVPFDGRGCLSPRIVIAEAAFADRLHEALLASPVPRGPLDDDERAALTAFRATCEATGSIFEGPHHAIGCMESSLLVPPEGRMTLVTRGDPSSIARHVTAIGGDGALADHLAALCPHARRSPLGRMQKPPLDGPVDLRTVARDSRPEKW
jgi:acyl-CoA reductase LuxC